jgi:hypothetical protein
MGNGVSSKEATALVHKWDRALDDLKNLTKDHQRITPTAAAGAATSMPKPIITTGGESTSQHNTPYGASSGRRSKPSLFSGPTSSDDGGFMSGAGEESTRAIGKHGDLVINSEVASSVSVSHISSPTHAARMKVSKSVAAANKAARDALFASYVMTKEQRREAASKTSAASNHFAAAAVALSSLLGGKRGDPREQVVTIEDIFFAAEVPLTYLQQYSIELEELHNILKSFVETDTRFRGNVGVEVVHLDVAPAVGHVTRGENRLLGEHSCKVTQPRLLESIKEDLANNDAVYLLQFDPYVLEQEMALDDDNDADGRLMASSNDDDAEVEHLSLSMAKMEKTNHSRFVTVPGDVTDANDGMVGVITGWRRIVLDTLRIAEAVCFEGNVIAISESEFPFPSAYKAMGTMSRGCGRARGYIRVFRLNDDAAGSSPQEDDVAPFLSHELMSGNVIGHLVGTSHAAALDEVLAPHIVATAWGLHLLRGTIESHHRHGYGLPVSDLIKTLRLPCDVYLAFDLPLDQVHLYLEEYIRLKNLDGQYNTELVPVITNSDRPGAVPSLTQHELDCILFEVTEANDDAEYPSVVILFQYDAAIAHNALGTTNKAQWGVLAGYDRERQLVRLIDANAKAFGRSWSVTCEWLLQAITGYGYIVLRHVSRLMRRQSVHGSTSLGSSLRVGTLTAAIQEVDGPDSWTPTHRLMMEAVNNHDGTQTKKPHGEGSRGSSPTVPPSRAFTQAQVHTHRHGSHRQNRAEVGALRHVSSEVRLRLDLVGASRGGLFESDQLFPSFTFPTVPLGATCLAAVLTRLGVPTEVDDVLLRSSFNVNDLLNHYVGLNSFAVVAEDYLEVAHQVQNFEVTPIHVATESQLSSPTHRADPKPPLASADDLIRLIQRCLEPQNTSTSVLIAHFTSRAITLVGGAHPFGTFGIITRLTQLKDDRFIVSVVDMHPNAFLRCWKVDVDVLYSAMEQRQFRGHRPRGCVLVRKLDASAVAARLDAQPKRSRPLSLSVAPFFGTFLTTVSPQIFGLSLAFAQLGYYFSPDEIFYEAYLKTVRSGTRRSSQARAWRDVDVSFEVLNRFITPKLLTDLANKFLSSRKERGLKVEMISKLSPENFAAELQEAANTDAPNILVVTYDASIVHGLSGVGLGTALVQSYDAEAQLVGMFDAEHTTFGLRWKCPLSTLIDACERASAAQDGSISVVAVRKVEASGADDELDVPDEIRGEFREAAF